METANPNYHGFIQYPGKVSRSYGDLEMQCVNSGPTRLKQRKKRANKSSPENTCEQKRTHRYNGVKYVLSTNDYRYFLASRWLRMPLSPQLRSDSSTPDVFDLNVSKRKLEFRMQVWRRTLQYIRENEM